MPFEQAVHRVVLPNGCVALLAEQSALPAVALYAIVAYGSRYESEDQAGLASLLGDMLDEGTAQHTAQDIALAIEATGARLNTFGGYARSGLGLTALRDDFPQLLTIAADLLRHSRFPEDRFTPCQARRLAQLRSRADDARTVASDAFDALVYPGHPAGRPIVGYETTVSQLTVDDLRTAYARFFVPNNLLIAIVGDLPVAEMERRLMEVLADWAPAPDFRLPTVPPVQRQTVPQEQVLSRPDKEQIHILLGHLGITRTHPDYHALRVMDVILGDSPGMTARIPRILRDDLGLAYTTYANITSTAGVDPGRFVAYIGTSPEHQTKAIAAIRDEIERMRQEVVTPEELAAAKAYLTGSFVFNFETNAQRALFLIETEIHGLGDDYAQRYPERIDAVTAEDVLRVSQAHLNPAALTTVIAGPVSSGAVA
ncbi:pitrilysin family protein [Chloracidobacterium aggregatum]|uniref:M16 family metallopeptidase n=1 Tax=Chloracidobacterium aggregatum TaxID=2851959 RepID=UPI001B8B4775|nr:pitrilysin family protein [Chloracidobacterium aggregatum]QUV95939.1 insulinase family protein [Chloracidobacterium sp. E]